MLIAFVNKVTLARKNLSEINSVKQYLDDSFIIKEICPSMIF